MYTLQWSDTNSIREACCAQSKDAWEIYWALRKSMEKQRPMMDCWIVIWLGGMSCNPEKGSALPFCREGEGPHFILKKAEEE